LGFLLLALLAAWPQSALALTASQVYEQVKDSVVVVKAYDQKGKLTGMGSGVILPSGDVITNYHVVKAGVRYTVGRGKQGTPATVKAGDPDKDLCLLHAPGLGVKGPHGGVFSDTPRPPLAAKPARLGKAVRLNVGEPVYAVGAPQGLELSLSEGIVSQLRGGPPPLIQTTVAISQGSSGGGLFNAEGELVGITTFYLKDAQSLNFALPVEWIAEVAGRKIRERPRGEAPGVPEVHGIPKEGWEDRGRALEIAQDWQGLLAHCRRWTQAEPRNDFAWFDLGFAYANLGRHREAIEAYRQALRLKPDDVNIWLNLGGAYGKLGRYREVVEASRQALRLKPDDADAWINLGIAYGKLGRHREAIAAYREALRFKPDDAQAWNNLAIAYVLSGNRSAALEAVKELRRYNPQKAEKLFNLIMKP
jgi:Flp pilus assembly protein TadD